MNAAGVEMILQIDIEPGQVYNEPFQVEEN